MTQRGKSARAPRPGKFVWFEHLSNDPGAAQRFYGEVIGWRTQRWGDSSYEMILAGEQIESMVGGYGPLEAGQKPRWLSYVSVEDVDAAARKAAGNGGRILEAPHELPGVGRVARILDPQGAELCLFKNAEGDPPDFDATAPPPERHFFWCELHTTDATSALSFCEKVLAFSHRSMDMGPAGTYHVISRDGVDRGGVSSHLQGAPPHWLPYVAVDDPDAAVARAARLGGAIHVPPSDIPGVGRFAVIEDPLGAAVAVMKAIPPPK